jgi:16S rRNA (adenine1518-N6/adenine1519-N6)-dimethyltransferase
MGFSGHNARKRFGQHWLVDAAVLTKIIEAAELGPSDTVLEIGPGRGALTERLLNQPIQQLDAIELDRDLVEGLQLRFGMDQRFRLQQGDALSLNLPVATKVVANIPYNITGPLLERLLGRLHQPNQNPYQLLVLLLQKEVAERITAEPGHSNFSALSVRMQLQAECISICDVPARCFRPAPKVVSEVICIKPFANCLNPGLAKTVEILLHSAFASRRKMLRNTLASFVPTGELQSWLGQGGISPQQRPQEVSAAQWVALASALSAQI